MQPQALRPQPFTPPAIVRTLAMRGVSDDWMRQVLEMAADLVPSTCVWRGLDQPNAGLRITIYRNIQAAARNQAEIGHSILGRGIRGCVIRAQSMIHVDFG